MGIDKVYRTGINNVVFSILAQGTFFVLSIVTGFLLPKMMGVTQYGYWQIYLFYTGYIMLFCFGYNDGLYLRYGSKDYQHLPFAKLRSAMRIFILVSSVLTIGLCWVVFLESDSNKVFAFCAMSVNLLIMGINGTLLTILQFTNQIKLNGILLIANKVVFVGIVGVFLLVQWIDFRLIILADIVTKLLLLGITIYKMKELFVGERESIASGFKEYWQNIGVGSKLMVANIMGSLLVGIGRFIVERYMSVESYSLYSFATTITTFALLFFTSSSLAMYPLLTRVGENKLPVFYKDLNTLLCAVLFLLLAGYYLIYYLISSYFGDFVGIFEYFFLLFIIVVSQGKMQFLINTYYKVLREEKPMLLANISGTVLAMVLIVPAFYYTQSVFAIVAGTAIALIWRCYASDVYLKKRMGIKGYSNILVELGMMGLFIGSVMVGELYKGLFLYLFAVFGYVFINRIVIRNYSRKIFIVVTARKSFEKK